MPASADVWWWPGGRADGLRPVLFFPPSGAEPSSALPLATQAAGLRFGVAQLPGRGARHDEPAPTELDPLITDLATAVGALDGPAPILVGHSFGGLLAYGVTARLEQLGVLPGRLVVVAAAAPQRWAEELRADRARHPDDDRAAFVARRTERILTHGGVPDELLAHPEFGARARELVAVDVGLSHEGFVARALRTPVTVVAARDDTVLAPDAVSGWDEIAGGGHTRIDVPGDHFFYRADPQRLVAALRMESHTLDGQYELL